MATIDELLKQQKTLERQQALVQALTGARFGGPNTPYTPLRALADVASGIGSAYATQKFGQKSDELSKELSGARAQMVADLFSDSAGPTPQAAASAMPYLDEQQQKLVQTLIGARAKKELGPADYARLGPEFDVQSRIAGMQGGGPDGLQPSTPTFGVDPQGNAYSRVGGTVRYAPRPPSLTVNNNPENRGAVAGQEAEAKAVTERLSADRIKAADALQMAQDIEQVMPMLDAGIISGPFADERTQLAKFGQALGLTTDEFNARITDTEAFKAEAAKRVANIIKAFGAGTGLSDADREYATKAAAGDITLDEKSLRRLLGIARKGAYNTAVRHNQEVERFIGSPLFRDPRLSFGVRAPEGDIEGLLRDEATGLYDLPPMAPEPAAAPAAAPMTPQEYIERARRAGGR